MDQLTLSFEPGLTQKYRDVLECIAAGVYKHGLQRVAGKLDEAPSNLSAQLSGNGRKFGVDELEAYLKNFDQEPLFYLIEKYLTDHKGLTKAKLIDQANALLLELRSVTAQMKD